MFSPQVRPHFVPETVRGCARGCAIAHQAAVLCELLTASISFLESRRREHQAEDMVATGGLRDSAGVIRLKTTADFSQWTLRTEERRVEQLLCLTQAVHDQTIAALPVPQDSDVKPAPEPAPEPEPEPEQPIPPALDSSGPEILDYLREVGWDKLLKQETSGELPPGDMSEPLSESLAVSAWGESFVSMAVRCGFPYRQLKGIVVVDTETGKFTSNLFLRVIRGSVLTDCLWLQVYMVSTALRSRSKPCGSQVRHCSLFSCVFRASFASSPSFSLVFGPAAEMRQRIKLINPEEEALNRIAAAEEKAQQEAQKRALAEAAMKARSLSGSASPPPPDEVILTQSVYSPPSSPQNPHQICTIQVKEDEPAPGSDIIVPAPDLIVVVENRYANPNEQAMKEAQKAKDKLADQRADHAETAARCD